MPFSFNDREVVKVYPPYIRLAPSIVFAIYFDDAVPLMMFHRNTDTTFDAKEDDYILKARRTI